VSVSNDHGGVAGALRFPFPVAPLDPMRDGPAMPVPVTLLYGGLCGLLVIGLAVNVSLQRGKHKAGVGQVPPEIVRAVRAHGNAAENVPLALVLLVTLELSGVSSLWLHLLGGGFVLGRICHAVGMLTKSSISGLGVTLNHLTILAMSILAVVWHFR
jgi:uncharacterized membrane protein YecN with MAPEG domain